MSITPRLLSNSATFQQSQADSAAALSAINSPGVKAPWMIISLFTSAHTVDIPLGTDLIRTKGHTQSGLGGAAYIYDSNVDVTYVSTYPLLSFMSSNNRGFRLSPDNGILTVEQGGALGTVGTNDQPSIRTILLYAGLVGVRHVRFLQTHYEVWAPTFPNVADLDVNENGHMFVIKEDMWIEGASPFTLLTRKGRLGGTDISGQASTPALVSGYASPWLGGGFYIMGTSGRAPGNCLNFKMSNLKMNGGLPYNQATREADTNLSDKGIRIQDCVVNSLTMENVEFYDFRGEIAYLGGLTTNVLATDCHFHGSPQSAWNPQVSGRVYAINLKAGNSYQPCEAQGGPGSTYVGGEFYNPDTVTFGSAGFLGGTGLPSGTPGVMTGYTYAYPQRSTVDGPPFINFIDTRFTHCVVGLSSYCRGKIVTMDAQVNVFSGYGALDSVDLVIEAWVDYRMNNVPAVQLQGVTDLVGDVPNTPAGTKFKKPTGIHLDIICHRTALAKTLGYSFPWGLQLSGAIDSGSCSARVSGDAGRGWMVSDRTIVGQGFELPLISTSDMNPSSPPIDTSTTGDLTILPSSPIYYIYRTSTTATNRHLTLQTSDVVVNGQKIKFVYYNNTGDATRTCTLARSGAGMLLNSDVVFAHDGDYVQLEAFTLFNGNVVWREVNRLIQT